MYSSTYICHLLYYFSTSLFYFYFFYLLIDIASLMLIVRCVQSGCTCRCLSKRIEEFVLMPLFHVLQLKATVLAFYSSKKTSLQCCFYLYLFFYSPWNQKQKMKTFKRKTKGSLHSKTALLLLYKFTEVSKDW